ncbi:RNA helicase, partial [Rice Picorna-like virus 3]
MVHAALANNWKNTAFALFGIVVELRIFTWEDWDGMRDTLGLWVRSITPGNYSVQSDDMNEHWNSVLTLLVTALGLKFQIKETKGIVEYFKHLFKYQNYKNVSGLNSIIVLSRTLYRSVATIYNYFCEMVDPNIRLLKSLQEKDGVLHTFVEEANNFLNSFNEKDFRKRNLRVQYLHMILRAFKLKTILLRISSPKLTSQLLVLCDKVIVKAQNMRYLLRCDTVIAEPFVVCVEGESNIGKSFSVYDMTGELLSATGMKFGTNQLIYTIPAAADYWNGYQDEPVLWFDDWCNLVDEQTMRAHLGQLYGLKTSAPFNVPRAELDNKEQIAAPMIVIMTTNNPFPLSNVMQTKEAVYRRRDCLVKFKLKGQMSQYTSEQLKNFEHLEVYWYTDATNPASCQQTGIPYSEFISELKKQFVQFREKEKISSASKLASLEKAIERTPIDDIDIGNPFDAIERYHSLNPEKLTSDLLNEEVEKLLVLIQLHCKLEKERVKDDDVFEAQGLYQNCKDKCKLVVHKVSGGWQNVSKYTGQWIDCYRKFTIKCANCGVCASVHGTVFYCPEHSHYVCLHCAFLAGEATHRWLGGQKGFYCPLSDSVDEGCELVVHQRNLYDIIIAETLAASLDKPVAFLVMIKKFFVGQPFGSTVQDQYCLVVLMQKYVKWFIKTIYSAFFRTQGLDGDGTNKQDENCSSVLIEDCDDCIEEPISTKPSTSKEAAFKDNDCEYALTKGQLEQFKLWYARAPNKIEVQDQIKHGVFSRWVEVGETMIPVIILSEFCSKYPVGDYGGEIVKLTVVINLEEKEDTKFTFDEVQVDCYGSQEWDPIPSYEEFQSLVKGGRDSNGTKYICPHSLLIFGYTYDSGVFYIYDTEIGVVDKKCKSKCAMTNMKVLRMFRSKFIFDDATMINIRKNPKLEAIQKYVPCFLRSKVFVTIEQDANRLKGLLRRNWWDHYISPIPGKVWKFIKTVSPLLLAGVALWGLNSIASRIWTLIQKMFGFETTQGLHNSGSTPTKRARPRTQRTTRVYSSQTAVSENFANKLDKICGNYICIQAGNNFMTGFGIRDSDFLLPKHLAEKLSKFSEVKIAWYARSSNALTVKTTSLKIMPIVDRDLVVVRITRSPPLFANVLGYMRTRLDPFDEQHHEAVVLAASCTDLNISEVHARIITNLAEVEAEAPDGTRYVSRGCVQYNYQAKGLCGSIVAVNSIRPIYAIHVAGNAGQDVGIGVKFYREDLEFVTQGHTMDEYPDNGEETTYYGDDCNILYVAAIDKDMVPFVPKQTTIIPSLIDKHFETPTLTQPAILCKSDVRYTHEYSPLYYGVRKNGKPTLNFEPVWMDRAFEVVKELILAGTYVREPKPLTIKEAIIGFPELVVEDQYAEIGDDGEVLNPYYSPIPLDTSAGFPYSSSRYRKEYGINGTDKKGWLEYVRDEQNKVVDVVVHQRILDDLTINERKRKNGVVPCNVFQDCLKDERRPIAKVLSQGGTRLFSMSNIEGTIALRQYTLDLTTHLRKNRLKNGIGVGINVDSAEWTILAQKLLAIEKLGEERIFTTDFTNFGAGLNYSVGTYFGDLIKDFLKTTLNEDDHKIIDSLIIELLGSHHVVGNLVYRTLAGSPSGAAITVEINSFVHLMYIVISFIIIGKVSFLVNSGRGKIGICLQYPELSEYLQRLGKLEDMDLNRFRNEVFCCTYGDDGIFSVSKSLCEQFNSLTINMVLSKHRIGVTDASKSEKIQKYTSIYDAVFLKRKFVPNDLFPSVMWSAAIDWSVVEECVRWIHKKPLSSEVATIENCNASLLLAYGHGREKYEAWRKRINEYLRRENLLQNHMDWDQVSQKFYPELVVKLQP